MNSRIRIAAALAALLGAAPLAAQRPDPVVLVPGSVLPRVVSGSDTAQSYALFLPARYDTTARWPLLLVMDPRGRALVPLTLLRQAADRYGYLLMSSYNTRSDEAVDPNEAALNAMIADAERLLRIDARRLYLVGFSGTARDAWDFAYRLDGHVAGIIGVGAGLPAGWTLPPIGPGAGAAPVFYGGAGTTDFNYEEVLGLDEFLARAGFRRHVAIYDGPHGWPPEPVMHDAVEWMELQAMRRDLKPVETAWIDSLYQARLDSARAVESAGDPLGAWRRYRLARDDFDGIRDVAAAASQAATLERSRPVRRALERQRETTARAREFMGALRQFIGTVRRTVTPPDLAAVLKDLSIRKLQREARDSTDRIGALAARRLLEHVFVVTGFYEPRDAFDAGNPARALLLLDVAEAIHPGAPSLCRDRKRALAWLGRDTTAAGPCEAPPAP